MKQATMKKTETITSETLTSETLKPETLKFAEAESAGNAVELNELSKTFPDGKKAVDHIRIQLAPGEIFGFLGPNGAGKTTTIKLLNGILTPTAGSCRVFGIDPAKDPEKTHAISGVVTEHAQMYDHLTGIQNLIFYGSLFGLSPAESKSRSLSLLEQLELSDAANKKTAAYSTGMRKRLSLARAMLHQPQILFLDEPTSGLDPKSAQNVHSIICHLAKENGITVFYCTHQLRYAQEICTRYGLMNHGQLLAQGTLDELRAQVCSDITVKIRADNLPAGLNATPVGTSEYQITVRHETEIPQIVRSIVTNGGELYHISASLPSLEDLYFRLTETRKEHV